MYIAYQSLCGLIFMTSWWYSGNVYLVFSLPLGDYRTMSGCRCGAPPILWCDFDGGLSGLV